MTQYQGNVQSYVLEIQSPNSPYDQKAVISLHGAFGLAILYFVPQDGQLGKNQKRAGHGHLRYLLLDGFLAAFDRPAPQREAGAIRVRRLENWPASLSENPRTTQPVRLADVPS